MFSDHLFHLVVCCAKCPNTPHHDTECDVAVAYVVAYETIAEKRDASGVICVYEQRRAIVCVSSGFMLTHLKNITLSASHNNKIKTECSMKMIRPSHVRVPKGQW